MNTGPISSYGPGSAPVSRAHLRSGAYDTSDTRSPGWMGRRQHRSGAPPSASVNLTGELPASSRMRSSARTSGRMGRTSYSVFLRVTVVMKTMITKRNGVVWQESGGKFAAVGGQGWSASTLVDEASPRLGGTGQPVGNLRHIVECAIGN